MPRYDDPLVRWDSPWVFWDDPGPGHPPPPLNPHLPSLGTAMEYWEHTKARAQATLPVWQQHVPTFKVNGQTAANLDTMINQFEPKAQERTTAQDAGGAHVAFEDENPREQGRADHRRAAFRECAIRKDLDDVFRIAPRTP
jgi:hypothetical protein